MNGYNNVFYCIFINFFVKYFNCIAQLIISRGRTSFWFFTLNLIKLVKIEIDVTVPDLNLKNRVRPSRLFSIFNYKFLTIEISLPLLMLRPMNKKIENCKLCLSCKMKKYTPESFIIKFITFKAQVSVRFSSKARKKVSARETNWSIYIYTGTGCLDN